MSVKEQLFTALQLPPPTIEDQAFPELVVPPAPTDVEDAIIKISLCDIEILKWLNTFKEIKIKELYGMVGMLSPSVLAIASGYCQSDGSALIGTTIPEFMKVLGDEESGGGITGNIESPERRGDTGETLGLLEKAQALVPAVIGHLPYLGPLVSLATYIYERKGRIAEEVGLILFNQIIDLLKQIIINELYPEDDENVEPIDQKVLEQMKDALETIADTEGIIDINGTRVWTRSKIVDSAD